MRTGFKYMLRIGVSGFLYSFYALQIHAADFLYFLPPPVTPEDDLITFIHRVINMAIGLAGLVAVVFLVYNGIMYIISSGDETKVEKATKGITYAVIGLIICFISVLLVNFIIGNVIGAEI